MRGSSGAIVGESNFRDALKNMYVCMYLYINYAYIRTRKHNFFFYKNEKYKF